MRSTARRVLEALRLRVYYQIATRGPLREDGWLRSLEDQSCVDAAGRPLPWLTYPAIEFLSARVRPGMRVFEYGAGNSTLWWAARVEEVVSCEHDRGWYDAIAPRVPANVMLRHVALEYGGAYCRVVSEFRDAFDLVVVDGRDRVNCAIHAVPALRPDGVLVWDNSDRDEYRAGYEFLAAQGFRKLPFIGLAPMINQKNETGIFYRDHNCLGL